MAHRPSGPGRIPRPAADRPGRPGRAAAGGFPGQHRWPPPGLGLVVVLVALELGISQATASPACASVIMPGTATVTGAAMSTAAVTGTAAGGPRPAAGPAARPLIRAGRQRHGELLLPVPARRPAVRGACHRPSTARPPRAAATLQVTGPDGSVTVEVVDQCPECQAGHIDLSEQAFARIAPLDAGLVRVSYHTVADPPLPAPVSILVKTGSSAYYLALLPINNGNPLASVAVQQGSGGWQELARTTYGYWLASLRRRAGPVHGPADRLPGASGHGERHHDQPRRRPGHRTSMYGSRPPPPRHHRHLSGTGEEGGPPAPVPGPGTMSRTSTAGPGPDPAQSASPKRPHTLPPHPPHRPATRGKAS